MKQVFTFTNKNMSRKEKLLLRFLSQPKDFTFDEAVRLLQDFGFYEVSTGKTSGSRVKFKNEQIDKEFKMHKPHPSNILKQYQLIDIKCLLVESQLLISKNKEDEE